MPQHIIIHGNPAEGFDHIGPFDCMDSAHDYATSRLDGDWWVKELTAPDASEVDAPHDGVPEASAGTQLISGQQHELPIFAVAVKGAAMSPINVRADSLGSVSAVVPEDASVSHQADTAAVVDFELPSEADAVIAFYSKRVEMLEPFVCELPGFSGHATKHLQLRVMAPNQDAVEAILGSSSKCFHLVGATLPPEEIDFTLPEDAERLRMYLASPSPRLIRKAETPY